MKKFMTVILAVILTACGADNKSPVDVQIHTEAILKKNGEEIANGGEILAILPDGRKLKYVKIEAPGGWWTGLYVLDGSQAVSYRSGKHEETIISK